MGLRLLMGILVALLTVTTADARVVVKLGTVAPEGSVWHDALLRIRQEWRSITHGEVELRIYAGGVLGGETEMVRKLQRRSLDAVAMTGAGLPRIDRSVDLLNIPLLFDSYDELDHVRRQMAPFIEARLEEQHFRVLSWADAGWVYFFTKTPVRTPDELRQVRLWVSDGEPRAEKLYKQFGFLVVPLPVTDVLTSLQTGLVEAIDVPPLFALLDRSYQAAPYMTDLRWAPLNAATVINTEVWARIPEKYRDDLEAAVQRIVDETKQKIRDDDEQAIAEMVSRGMTVVTMDEETRAWWRREAEAAYPTLRENTGLPELFDQVLKYAAEYKASLAACKASGTTVCP